VRRRASAAAALSLLIVAAVACDGSDADVGELEEITWVLDRASIDALVPEAPADARVDARFDDGEVSGRSACNSYFGAYEIDDGSIGVEGLGGTEMACDPPVLMELEVAYLDALGRVDAFVVEGSRLSLTGGEPPLVFEAEPPAEPRPLVGSVWRLSSLAYGSDTVSSPIAGAQPTARFSADDEISGSTGCNTYGGSYRIDGSAISIGGMRITLRGCEPDVARQEDVFHRALQRAATFRIEGEILTLSDAAGAFLVSFTAG
jgi:heat shock protein HslJ